MNLQDQFNLVEREINKTLGLIKEEQKETQKDIEEWEAIAHDCETCQDEGKVNIGSPARQEGGEIVDEVENIVNCPDCNLDDEYEPE